LSPITRASGREFPRAVATLAFGRHVEEDPINEPDLRATSDYAETFLPEEPATVTARERARDSGVDAISPSVGACLAFLAATLDAQAVVDIGTGTGVAACWLMRGMPGAGVLTTIDTEAEDQRRSGLLAQSYSPHQRLGTRCHVSTRRCVVRPRFH